MKSKIIALALLTVVVQCYAHFNKECKYCNCKMLITEHKNYGDCVACGHAFIFHDIKPLK